ncbi:uncharacterized protein CCOS01_03345 [Colletotrichum costaricense]|uniref:Uncharacterized protein n=1 Tax=Colletotrichum costaricense TaxID=1209916 RepID=A0AAJ0E5N3_9PEZI|nr:uncharacterized protein CCOS01_03345 [Colletotrichum costaricense]KAK1534593.1 hypothetical protein CCOS01_03345 [Colletotrichum costaricense]
MGMMRTSSLTTLWLCYGCYLDSFLPILIFPQTMAPTFERGFPSILSFALAAVVLVLIADFLHKHQL